MPKLVFTIRAATDLTGLSSNTATEDVSKAVRKALGYLELNPRHPSLQTHKYTSMRGPKDEEIFEAYAQNNTPGSYRIFWHYGPDEVAGKKRIPVITIVAITPHP